MLLIGDVSFFHDQNGLFAARQTPNLAIVLLNNNGGGIFRRLPVAKLDPPFTDLFITPHNLDFTHAARMHGFSFTRTASRAPFRAALAAALKEAGAAIVEYVSDSAVDEEQRRGLVRRALEGRG